MDFFPFIIAIVAIGAGSSMITSIVNAIKPKIREKDIARIKDEIKQELTAGDPDSALPDMRDTVLRLENLESQVVIQERQIEELSEENSFLKRLIDKS